MYLSFDIGLKNLAYCIVKRLEPLELGEWEIVDISGPNIHEISRKCIVFLDELYPKLDAEITVLIENQPVYKNPTMKTVQIVIYTYFQMLAVHDVLASTIVFCSASQKNKYLKKHGYAVTDYKSAKKSSIEYVAKVCAIPEGYKKKDDLSDALLQVFAHAL